MTIFWIILFFVMTWMAKVEIDNKQYGKATTSVLFALLDLVMFAGHLFKLIQ